MIVCLILILLAVVIIMASANANQGVACKHFKRNEPEVLGTIGSVGAPVDMPEIIWLPCPETQTDVVVAGSDGHLWIVPGH